MVQIALLRGINVGRAKRVGMGDLRALFADLGYTDISTLLNSGNVIFSGTRAEPAHLEQAFVSRFGFGARFTVLTTDELREIVAANPLTSANDSRLLVTVLTDPAHRTLFEPLLQQDWTPEALAVVGRAIYLWCPDSILASPVNTAVSRILGDLGTARNWATIKKLHAIASDKSRSSS